MRADGSFARLPHMTDVHIPRPTSGDVVDVILDDHRLFESLLRDLRDATADREAARSALSSVLIAHGEAEEAEVYPKLVRRKAIGDEEAEHGEEEHAEGHEALLAVLECAGTDTQKFDDAVEELARVVGHHLTEEELTILNPARDDVGPRVRENLGQKFADERNSQIDDDCGRLANVRRIVSQARKEGLLED